MIEYAPLVILASALMPKMFGGKMNDKKRIEDAFINLKFGFKIEQDWKRPKFLRKVESETFTRYDYGLPSGLVIKEDMGEIISNTLGKPVEVSGSNVMFIKVYKQDIPNRWEYRDVPTNTKGWVVPVGKSHSGIIWHDFDKIPHMNVSGATRWGKTVFLKAIMTYLIERHGDNAEFYIMDLKGKLAFNKYRHLKQVKYIAGNIRECHTLLNMIKKDIIQREAHWLENDLENITETDIPVRKFIFLDEGGEIAINKGMEDEEKEMVERCQYIMSTIARVSGGLGYRLIFSTQYPTADILDRQIKANSSAKVAFRLQTTIQSGVAIDEGGAEKLERVGQAIYRTVDKHIVQSPYISNEEIKKRLRRFEGEKTAGTSSERGKNTFKFR